MGGRGGAGGRLGTEEVGRGRGLSLAKFLSQQDINRANAASVTDIGDIIKRTFERNATEINSLDLPDSEKKDAVRKMAELATSALKTAAGAVNPYASGRSRLTKAQITGSAADRAARARGEMGAYMRELRNQSSANRKAAEKKAVLDALTSAGKSGSLEITVNGKTYRRANKRSKTWWSV